MIPLNVSGKCVMEDDALFEHIRLAIARGLPELNEPGEATDIPLAICGSGPSIATQLDKLREFARHGAPILAVRDAHDYLIEHGIIPTFALSVDPLPTAAECFKNPHPDVTYLIGSQSHPAMLDYLKGSKVVLWHLYMKHGQREPKNRMLIGGTTTSGVRAISVAYTLGYRHFKLFGLDSCVDGETLRVNGTKPKAGDIIAPVQLEPDGEVYYANAAMALQAQNFQDVYSWMPDATFESFGHGLITAIIAKRNRQLAEYEAIYTAKMSMNNRVSFIHSATPFRLIAMQVISLKPEYPGMDMASFRYRCVIPADENHWSINDYTAGTLIFSKPRPEELVEIGKAKAAGKRVIVDFCDDHFEWMHYQECLRYADAVVCNTPVMAEIIKNVPHFGREVDAIIPDPYEYPEVAPHFSADRILWFGRDVNKESIYRVLPEIASENVHLVSNFKGAIPWSHEIMLREFAWADIVILPKTADYKSANRAVEAIRQGCFVVAEPHPSLMEIPGIWIGSIQEGLAWVKQQPIAEVRHRTSLAQKWVNSHFTPKIVASMWKTVTALPTTSDAETSTGQVGSTSISEMMPT